MKVVERSVNRPSGATVLDPYRFWRWGLPGGAVLTVDRLAVSTMSCVSHDDIAEACGIDEEPMDMDDPDPLFGRAHLALGVDDDVSLELWSDECAERSECPYSEERLARLRDWVLNHPAMRAAYAGRPEFDADVLVLSSETAQPVWRYGADGLSREDDFAYVPSAAP